MSELLVRVCRLSSVEVSQACLKLVTAYDAPVQIHSPSCDYGKGDGPPELC